MKDLHFFEVRLANHSDVRVRVWVRCVPAIYYPMSKIDGELVRF